ncbi:MAG: AraC family transcriptional regulator [Sphaerochaetaceae bacterium]|nr:AraC family transcriptional regulator [Sphaerochaetaceae bacterium]
MKNLKEITQTIGSLCDLPSFIVTDGQMEVVRSGFLTGIYSLENIYSFLFRNSFRYTGKVNDLKKPRLVRSVNYVDLSFLAAVVNTEPLTSICFGPFFLEKHKEADIIKHLCSIESTPFNRETATEFIDSIPAKDSAFLQSMGKVIFNMLGFEYPPFIKISNHYEDRTYRKEIHTIADNRINEEEINSHYEFEHRIKALVRQGNSEKLHSLLIPKDKSKLSEIKRNSILQHKAGGFRSIRAEKNLILTMNTLFRQAVDDAGLPPVFIHSISEEITADIEKADSSEELMNVVDKMIDSYCNSINNAALQNHSRAIVRVQRYVLTHVDTEIKLDDLVKMTGLDKSYLCRLFKKECGMTINEYITNQRINEAKWILESTDKSITEISNLLGYSSQSYFCSVFKKTTGVSPAHYRMNRGGFYRNE